MSYGPFRVPDMSVDGGMVGYEGYMPNPCADGKDCLVTWMRAGLQYVNGSVADADSVRKIFMLLTWLAPTSLTRAVPPKFG